VGNQDLARSRLVPLTTAASLDPARLLPVSIGFDDLDTPSDVIDALILSAFADGRQPYARSVRLEQVRPGACLTPPGAQTLRVALNGRQARLMAGDDWTARTVLWHNGTAEVTVTAATDEVAEVVIGQIVADAAVEQSDCDGRVTIGFWHHSDRRGPCRSARVVSAEPWSVIRGNYPGATAAAMDPAAIRPGRCLAQIEVGHFPAAEAAAWLDRPSRRHSRDDAG